MFNDKPKLITVSTCYRKLYNHCRRNPYLTTTPLNKERFTVTSVFLATRAAQYSTIQRSLAVAEGPCDCCAGQFWPNVSGSGRRYFADIIGPSSTTVT